MKPNTLNLNNFDIVENPVFSSKNKSVSSDPLSIVEHTLTNGLKIFMSINPDEPRIFTQIVVRAGSKQDPADTTGLAHYLEHMMFKGTSQIGSLDWGKESALLSQIAELYEQHRQETDPSVRKALYAKIDVLSGEAAQYVAANEYDKLISALGARSTNAYTSVEQTVFVNDIPSNELAKWLFLEAERFKTLVLRLFHTELETVYEEFNISQDNDGRKVYNAMMRALFPTHPYGTQTIIGTGEDLKNPSHHNIQRYFNTYYVPNNMAIVLAGDFDPAEAIKLCEQYFGSFKPAKTLPPFAPPPQYPLQKIEKIEVFGQQAESLQLAWQIDSAHTDEQEIASLISVMLYNQQAGLIDLDLIQKQQVLEARAGMMSLAEYGALIMYGKPRSGQSLEEVEKLLVAQMNRIKKGDFPDWLIEAVITDFKYSQTKSLENNQSRAALLTDAFVKNLSWSTYIQRIERMKKLTKAQIVAFANQKFSDNYVVIYKKQGDDPSVMLVEKPQITPINLDRNNQSAFAEQFKQLESPNLKPVFIDFEKTIQFSKLDNGLPFDYLKNTTNDTFSLYYIFEMGSLADRKLALALSYLNFLGTDKYSAAELQQEFYKLGLNFEAFSHDEACYVMLKGLGESFERGVRLVEHILAHAKGDEPALGNMKADILAKRQNEKQDKRAILRNGLVSFAKFGAVSPFTDILREETLMQIQPDELVQKIKTLCQFEHRIFYYGHQSAEKVAQILNDNHTVSSVLTPVLTSKKYPELATEADEVLFVHFPMVQTEILMLSKGTSQYSQSENAMAMLYNQYFGYGLSSVVFQEIREAQALAYSANCVYSSPSRKHHAHYLQAYVGTQPDKMAVAINTFRQIIDEMPLLPSQIDAARVGVLKSIENERITRDKPYWAYRQNTHRGIVGDHRKPIYDTFQKLKSDDLADFQQEYIKGRKFKFLILGDRERLDFNFLSEIGRVEELTLDTIFGY